MLIEACVETGRLKRHQIAGMGDGDRHSAPFDVFDFQLWMVTGSRIAQVTVPKGQRLLQPRFEL
jgi:hypothetical protein